jgi:tetratricopeptide (TPR) repeat protein
MPNWALIAASTGAVVATLGLIGREWQQRSDNLSSKITREVDAKLGSYFSNLLSLQDRFTEQVEKSSAEVETLQMNLQERVSNADEVRKTLDDLLARANEAIPEVMKLPDARPPILLAQIDQASSPQEIVAILYLLRDSESASSKQLERGGDVARQRLADYPLARTLYELAIQRDPRNISARAELLSVDGRGADAEGANARRELAELAQQNPTQRWVIVRAIDMFLDREEYSECRNFLEAMMKISPLKSLLWRNLAICRRYLDDSSDSVKQAYTRSIRFARETSGGDRDIVNTSRSYVQYLLQGKEWDEAKKLIVEAIQMDPLEGELHFLNGDLERARNHFDQARASYQRAIDLSMSDTEIQALAAQSIKGLEVLQEFLNSEHLSNAELPTSDESTLSPLPEQDGYRARPTLVENRSDMNDRDPSVE